MEDTLLIGGYLIATSPLFTGFLYSLVEHDQIVVFRYPLDPGTYLVKRVIGVPGDRIRLEDKQLFRNGVAIKETYAAHKSLRPMDYRDSFPVLPAPEFVFPDWAKQLPDVMKDGVVVVPPGQYFVMGDNRDFSSDSRYWGFVPQENIVGIPLVIYWSVEDSLKPRWSRIFSRVR